MKVFTIMFMSPTISKLDINWQCDIYCKIVIAIKVYVLLSLGKRQVIGLKKLKVFHEYSYLTEEENQEKLKAECLKLWKVPADARKAPARGTPDKVCKAILKNRIGQSLIPLF